MNVVLSSARRFALGSALGALVLSGSISMGFTPQPAYAQKSSQQTLGADDVIEILVTNHSSLNKVIEIRPDGSFSFPRAGEIQAAGRTTGSVASEIEAKLARTLNNARVTVGLKEVNSRRVRIIGSVRNPGPIQMKPGFKLMDAIATGGGLAQKPARISGRVIRSGGVIKLNVAQAVQQPQSSANIALKPNDLIVLDELNPPQVNVIGKVTKPGPYDLKEDTTVLSVVTEAGGLMPGAALRKAYVLRGSQQMPLDLYGAFVEGRNDTGIEKWKLKPGDVLVVPENESKFSVMGQVVNPGFYPYPENNGEATLLKALQKAGGQMANGDLRNATITRVVDGKSVVTTVDIETRLRGQAPDDVRLEPGDLLYIPVARNQVYVVGKVNKPGPVELQENTTLISLVTDAGGPASGASLRKAYIMRGAEQIPLNLYGFYVDGKIDPQTNAFAFKPGDVLMVPENQARFAVYGAVGSPGYFPMPENPNDATVLKAISIAGGASAQSADLAKAGIIRREGTQTKIIPIDIATILKDGKLQGNVTLQAEDILYVPDRKTSKSWIEKIMQPLGILRVFGLGF